MSEIAVQSAHAREWIALSLTQGIGLSRCKRLLQRFGDVENIFRASLTELEAAGLPAAAAQAIALGKSLRDADAELEKAQRANVHIVPQSAREYPQPLREIYDPPMVLYVRGNVEALSDVGIAMVGTRHPTPYGVGMAERLASDLVARGFVIFSGMARGIDAAAHRGAVKSNGKTVGVFGTGVDVFYPKENAKVCQQVLDCGGALVSEFPLGTSPKPENFPIRNRIISGLSYGVLVVEAGEYSGTRITARCALEQGREVFAVPGNVTNKNAWGPNTLIKQGAKLVATWEDVWEEIPTDIRLRMPSPEKQLESHQQQTASLFEGGEDLTPGLKKLFALIRPDESVHVDTLVEKLEGQMSSSQIFSGLFELELSGKIRQLPGKNFVRVF